MEFLINIVFFVFGYWFASKVFSFHLTRALKRIAKENGIDLEEEVKPEIHKIPVLITERVDNGILLYDSKNNFMCQGNSLDEVAENLLKYKNIKLALLIYDSNKFWCVEGKVERV